MTPDSQHLDHVRTVLEAAGWVFAKTMPENPHWYTLRKTWSDDAAFVEVVEFIRRHGYREKFKGSRYTVMVIGGHKYWTMGWPIGGTVLINRKPVV